ncbi:hypothetical protein PsAD2_02353 [Pseudovibrio axinellae]|uniref:Uncharacterized protein n=1 Tax=Pseudovibrio axinellae TaxID=989403 RepID=A0A165YH15_9HYPH|nr:hypothetical protein [Pseudovibrio axinellae]KZL18837.1 hypothetical protein PsAD2_02353 [Pseudovibrio axinellae]SEP90946.1 hypothetical protein SAMN05421798_101688 [Pseudovibrio axinellae]
MDMYCEEIGVGDLSPELLTHANINPSTGLATDYLNHFNEVVMLLEMLPDIPECAEDVLAWAPADYITHFRASSFSEKELAIRAYGAVEERLRNALEMCIAEIDREVITLQEMLSSSEPSEELLQTVQGKAVTAIRPLLSQAGSIIHGQLPDDTFNLQESTQADVDALFS